MQKCGVALLLVAGFSLAQAQEQSITWKGELRVRGVRDFRHRTPMKAYTLLRTRLGAEIVPTSNVMLFLQLQDSRLFGQHAVTAPGNAATNVKNVDLHQGYPGSLEGELSRSRSDRAGKDLPVSSCMKRRLCISLASLEPRTSLHIRCPEPSATDLRFHPLLFCP